MTVRELKEQLEGIDEDLVVGITSPEFFPFTRLIHRVGAVAVASNLGGVNGVFVLSGSAVGPRIKTEEEAKRG